MRRGSLGLSSGTSVIFKTGGGERLSDHLEVAKNKILFIL